MEELEKKLKTQWRRKGEGSRKTRLTFERIESMGGGGGDKRKKLVTKRTGVCVCIKSSIAVTYLVHASNVPISVMLQEARSEVYLELDQFALQVVNLHALQHPKSDDSITGIKKYKSTLNARRLMTI